MLIGDVGSKILKKNASCWRMLPTAFPDTFTTTHHLFFKNAFIYSSLPALEHKVHKGMALDCLVRDCSVIGCWRVFIAFGRKHGGRVFVRSLAITSEARWCCDNCTNLQLCSIWRWLYRKLNFQANVFISWKDEFLKRDSFAPSFGSQRNRRLSAPFPLSPVLLQFWFLSRVTWPRRTICLFENSPLLLDDKNG